MPKTKKKQEEGTDPQLTQDSPPEQELEELSEETQAGQDLGNEGGGFDFQHPMLKGKTPEEIEEFVAFQDRMVRNQQEQLRARQVQQQAAPQPQTPSEPEVTDDDFYNKPVATMQQLMRRMLKEEIEPFKQDLQKSQQAMAREELRNEFGDFAQMEPYIDQIISANNFPNPNDKGLLRTLYFTAKGMMSTQGGTQQQNNSQERQTSQSTEPNRTPRQAPPQHRPSASPLPSAQDSGGKKVQLTEDEKRMAREWKMTPEEFARLRDADTQGFMGDDDE